MQRINSANARPDVNGTGKAGFHDNADLSGQDATYLTPDFLNTLQEELANLLEKHGIALDSANRQQLYELLATFDDVQALAEAMAEQLTQAGQDRQDGDANLQQQISEVVETLQQQISNLASNIANTYPKTRMAGVLTSSQETTTHTVTKPDGSNINFLDLRYAIILQVEARYNNGFYLKRSQDSFEVFLNVDDSKSGELNSRNIGYVVYETEGISTTSGNGDYNYSGREIAVPILAGESKAFLIIGAGGGGGSSRYVDLLATNDPEALLGTAGQDSYVKIQGTSTIFTAGGGQGGIGGIHDLVNDQSIAGIAGGGGLWDIEGEHTSPTRANGASGNATGANHTGASTDSSGRGAGGDGADGYSVVETGFGGGAGEGARLSLVYTNNTSTTQYAIIYVGKGGIGERSLNTYDEDGELVEPATENYEIGGDGANGFIRVLNSV
uniref:hypothetical protein n=1 Tax=uncultured Acinetobacter sp. TaxID=165433 RepID=UPI00263792C1|nr:hypothetical protein [uncultured Acinetobacter sp.]